MEFCASLSWCWLLAASPWLFGQARSLLWRSLRRFRRSLTVTPALGTGIRSGLLSARITAARRRKKLVRMNLSLSAKHITIAQLFRRLGQAIIELFAAVSGALAARRSIASGKAAFTTALLATPTGKMVGQTTRRPGVASKKAQDVPTACPTTARRAIPTGH